MRSDLKNRNTVTSAARATSEAFENASDLASPCCATKENSCFKENINVNKSGGSNLSLEPQKMKRKKKGGKCNLRNSLAWDRAFYTEEGVLDPLELSAMSGVSCRGGLPFISGDTSVSSSQEENFLKDNDRITSTSLASHKVLTNASSKSGSKFGDCPRPLPSPSLKRRANAHVGKATGSDFKLPKVPGLKPGHSPTCDTTRSTILRGSRVKHNQITQPDFSIQRDMELKSSSKSHKNTQNPSRTNTLQSALHSYANSGTSSFNRHLSINMIPMTVDEANDSCPKMISDNLTQIRPENSCDSQRYDSAAVANPNFQNAHINGRTLHPSQIPTMKPSGLRMPSPSLSFFSQPKPSVFRDLPLLDNLSRTTKFYAKIPDSKFSSNKVIYGPESTASSHVQDRPKKDIIVRKSHEGDRLQKIGIEVPSQSESREQAMGSFPTNVIDDFPVKSESCGNEWRNAELGSTQDYAILKSQTSSAVLNQDSIQRTYRFDDRVQYTSAMHSDGRKTGNDKIIDKNIYKEKERASEQLGVPQQYRILCSEKIKDLEQGDSMAESPYFESKHLCSIEVLTDNLPAAETHMQNPVYASTVKNDTIFMSEVGDDIKQPVQSPEVQISHLKLEWESKQMGKLNTSDRLCAEKQLSLQNSQQDENVEKLLLVASDRKDGNKVIQTKMPSSLSLGKNHKRDLGKEAVITQPLRMVGFDSVDNSLSSDCDDRTSYENLSDCLHLDTQRIETNYSPLRESVMCQLSPEDNLKKQTAEILLKQVGSADNGMTSTMPLKDTESEVDKVTQTHLVRSSESNMLSYCCFQQSECLALGGDEFVAENLVQSSDCMQTKHQFDVYSPDNGVRSTKDSVTCQSELQSISRSSTPAKESPLKHETCNGEYGTGGGISDAMEDPSRVEPFSDTIIVEVSEDAKPSFSSPHPKLDSVTFKTKLLPNSNHEGGLEEKKSLSVVIPPNATPFSDEWLAAIEAAGEDILTRKSGAVQNSPPDKSLPEPSPWSPVKKKNSYIGPFDCTKCTAPSDS